MKLESTLRLRPMALAVLALAGGLSLGACNKQEDPAETSRDMSEERAEGNENFNDGASAKTVVGDAHEVEVEKIKADHEVAKERCDGVPAPEQDQCRKDADAAYDTALKAADEKKKALTPPS